ncbi:MAG: hypothetical protein WC554_15100, partial [Clostridia bacterium]
MSGKNWPDKRLQERNSDMCRAASFVITQKNCYFSRDNDSHEQIIRENNLGNPIDAVRGRADVSPTEEYVFAEVVPPNDDYRLPIEQWVYHLDSDDKLPVPGWYNAEIAEQMCREKLPQWYTHHVITSGEHHSSGDISRIIIGGVLHLTGQTGGDCWANEGGTVNATGQTGGRCWANEGGTVNATGQTGGRCWAGKGGTVNATGQTGG